MKDFFPLVVLFYVNTVFSQINFPRVSPSTTITQTIGLTEITIQYSRPAVQGRKIFGDLVPFGRIWRVGANESTKLTLSNDCKINGKDVPARTYALYAIPQKEIWTIIIHKNTGPWGDGRTNYNPKEDHVRYEVNPETLLTTQEAFTIEFDHFSHDGADMIWLWENMKISFQIEVDTDSEVMEEVRKRIAENPTADTYYQAARFFYEKSSGKKSLCE